jgi:hypothetical protein
MTTLDKSNLLDQLSACYNRANYVSLLVEAKAWDSGARLLIERQKGRLNAEIGLLLQDICADWKGDGLLLREELAHVNEALTQDLQEIEHETDVDRHLAEASGHIKDAIDIAAGLVSADDSLECYLGVYCASPRVVPDTL